jgi:hypothetical protein
MNSRSPLDTISKGGFLMSFMNAEMKEAIRYCIEGNDILQQFLFDQTGLIGQVDWNKFMRFRIKRGPFHKRRRYNSLMKTANAL